MVSNHDSQRSRGRVIEPKRNPNMQRTSDDGSKRPVTRLWVGGSSGLAETYFLNRMSFPLDSSNHLTARIRWILVGRERSKPDWMPSSSETELFEYKQCDLIQTLSIHDLLFDLPDVVDQVVLSIRPPLVTWRPNPQAFRYNEALLEGFVTLLESLKSKYTPALVIHVSSIAAIDHLQRQHLRAETSEPDPSSASLHFPYDWFKRQCEEHATRVCNSNDSGAMQPIAFTNLRFGAIFSDSRSCIQCSALALQALVGPYLDVPIDCNSSRNASLLLHKILAMDKPRKLRPVYYYTRPLLYPNPVPYGEYLVAYRVAYNLSYAVWIPNSVVRAIVAIFHLVTEWLGAIVPYLQSVDYLLQVTCHEHTFDHSALIQDFGPLQEESIQTCFQRRRQSLRKSIDVRKKLS